MKMIKVPISYFSLIIESFGTPVQTRISFGSFQMVELIATSNRIRSDFRRSTKRKWSIERCSFIQFYWVLPSFTRLNAVLPSLFEWNWDPRRTRRPSRRRTGERKRNWNVSRKLTWPTCWPRCVSGTTVRKSSNCSRSSTNASGWNSGGPSTKKCSSYNRSELFYYWNLGLCAQTKRLRIGKTQ